jgi:hypothetical protein
MSYILFRGGLTKNISDVILFDALYGQTEKFFYWLEHSSGRLINIYTDDGGTKGETLSFLEELKQWKYPLLEKQENEISDNDLARNRIIFIHSNRSHNEVISSENQFLRFLRSSQLGERR